MVVAQIQITHYKRLESLLLQLKQCSNGALRQGVLKKDSLVKIFLKNEGRSLAILNRYGVEKGNIFLSLIALGEKELILSMKPSQRGFLKKLDLLIDHLLEVDRFYREIGGLIGYVAKLLFLIEEKEGKEKALYHSPSFIDISEENLIVKEAILDGILSQDKLVEVYPVGGAADRLALEEWQSKRPLPAARFQFCGKTLLEWLISDLSAKEYLHYKITGNQIVTPIVLMTSKEKDNYEEIFKICDQKNWFDRPKNSFFFLNQPLVPTVDRDGKLCFSNDGEIQGKPGGHGVIWKLASDMGLFKQFIKDEKSKILVRQINNPLSGVDYGLTCFVGLGFKHDKKFGFSSCPSEKKAMEGINLVEEKKRDGKFVFSLTNVEYCEFEKKGLLEKLKKNERFFSNTNLLFADIEAVDNAVATNPFPGLLVNFKKIGDRDVGRLESTMQNMADTFEEVSDKPFEESFELKKTFLTHNIRRKTISAIKRSRSSESLLETPEGAFLSLLENAKELLQKCSIEIEESSFFSDWLKTPPFYFLYHPALGPFYSIISQKIRSGYLAKQSELDLQIAELEITDLHCKGSLRIIAEHPLGHKEEGMLSHSMKSGRCILKNVKVDNKGVDWQKSLPLWLGQPFRQEQCEIVIKGSGEFIAEDVTFTHDVKIIVEDQTRVRAKEIEGKLVFETEILTSPSWQWRYEVTNEKNIYLHKEIL